MAVQLEFPIFPLDSVLLVPGGMLPLHIFEPRYRAMVRDCLDGDRRFAMAAPMPGHSSAKEARPPVHPVCCLGEIVDHKLLPDGRSLLLLKGISRARILGELEVEAPYRVVRAELVPELRPDDDSLERGVAELRQLLEDRGEGLAGELAQFEDQVLVDTVLLRLDLEPAERLRLYADARVHERLRWILSMLRLRPNPGIEVRGEDPRLN
ncbi:MAG: LON peptidase substrate-binding domain-containing protein [Planctomycetota bacterium]